MIKIGIDLALNSCGICVIDDNNKVLWCDTHQFIKRDMNLHTEMECRKLVEKILDKAKTKTIEPMEVYIEIGNYGNARMTQKFGILAGMLIGSLIGVIAMTKTKFYLMETKLITPNEWFSKFIKDVQKKESIDKHYNQLTREDRKRLSIKYSGLKQDDTSDAYWIAYYGKECKGAY